MIEPLPIDLVVRIASDFSGEADPVIQLLLEERVIGTANNMSDRVARCVVHAAKGSVSRLISLVELNRQDFRDVIMAAEYEHGWRSKNFNLPFDQADLK